MKKSKRDLLSEEIRKGVEIPSKPLLAYLLKYF